MHEVVLRLLFLYIVSKYYQQKLKANFETLYNIINIYLKEKYSNPYHVNNSVR